jgi:hypothetical protein
MIHVDALPLHKKYSRLFLMDDVPEAERKETAQLTAEKILLLLQGQNGTRCGGACSCSE